MKRFLILSIIFSMILFCFASFSFAASDLAKDAQNTTNAVGQAIDNTANHAKNAIQNGENKVEGALKSGSNTVMNTTKNTVNGVENAGENVARDIQTSDYDATRTATATTNNFLGMNSTTWMWVILAIVGIAIVALVWYYGAQYEHTNYSDGE